MEIKKMKKPEKKLFKKNKGFISLTDREFGYNQAIDDYEKYLPSGQEINNIIKVFIAKLESGQDVSSVEMAKAIYKRIKEGK